MTTRIITFMVLLAAALPGMAAGPGVTLAWDASTEAGVVHRLYYGVAPRSYSQSLEAGPNLTLTVGDLVPGVTYYFSVAARFVAPPSVESELSNEVSYTVPPVLAAPTSVGFLVENGKVVLTWVPPAEGLGVTRYKIYHAMGTDAMTFFAITTDVIPRFELGILAAGHHRWAITAQRGGLEESALSEEVDFWKAPVPTGFMIVQTGLVILPSPGTILRIQKPP